GGGVARGGGVRPLRGGLGRGGLARRGLGRGRVRAAASEQGQPREDRRERVDGPGGPASAPHAGDRTSIVSTREDPTGCAPGAGSLPRLACAEDSRSPRRRKNRMLEP